MKQKAEECWMNNLKHIKRLKTEKEKPINVEDIFDKNYKGGAVKIAKVKKEINMEKFKISGDIKNVSKKIMPF